MTNQQVDNNRLPEYVVKTTELADTSQIQHMRLDVGVGTAEDVVSSSNPLPVSSTTADANLEVLQDLVQALKQIRKTLEPIATQDGFQRQRIVIESLTGINSITGAQNITNVNPIVQGNSAPVAGTYTFQPVWEGPVEQRWRVMDDARTLAYVQRQNLTFS